MQLVILTPLFPPDTGAPAPYAKLLTHKLAATHAVTVLAHGTLPEHVPNAHLITIPKHTSKLSLLLRTVIKLSQLPADMIIINNGLAAEGPALLYSYFSNTPLLLIESDPIAHILNASGIRKLIHEQLRKKVRGTITLPPDTATYLPAEVLPFTTPDIQQQTTQTTWWKNHLSDIEPYASKH